MPRLSTAEACLPPLPDDAVFQLLVSGAPKVGHLCPVSGLKVLEMLPCECSEKRMVHNIK